jgi:hypothetical protein
MDWGRSCTQLEGLEISRYYNCTYQPIDSKWISGGNMLFEMYISLKER